jgi:hypothetical protein
MTRAADCPPLRYAAPLDVEAHFRSAELADAAMVMPLVRRVSERAVGFTAPSVPEMMRFFGTAVQLMQPVRERTLWTRIQAATDLNAIQAEWYNEIMADWIAGRSPFTASARALNARMA